MHQETTHLEGVDDQLLVEGVQGHLRGGGREEGVNCGAAKCQTDTVEGRGGSGGENASSPRDGMVQTRVRALVNGCRAAVVLLSRTCRQKSSQSSWVGEALPALALRKRCTKTRCEPEHYS